MTELDEHRPLALDAAEHIIKMLREGYNNDDCLSEGADVILEAFEKMRQAELRASLDNERANAEGLRQNCTRVVAENERLRYPWRAVDQQDWDYIMSAIGYGGRDQFWKSVLTEMRQALEQSAESK